MPISIVWDDEAHTIMRHVVVGQWTWQDYKAIIVQSQAKLVNVDHRVDVIADLRHSGPLPTQNPFPVLRYIAAQPPTDPDNIFIVVGGGSFVQTLGRTFKKAYQGQGTRFVFTGTLAEAHAIIQEDRAQPRSRQSTSTAV